MGLVRAACSNFSWRLQILVERDNSIAVTYLGSCKPFDLPLPDTLINKPERQRIDIPHEMCRKAANEDSQMGLKKGNSLQQSVSWGIPSCHPSHMHMGCRRGDVALLGVGCTDHVGPWLGAAALQSIWVLPLGMSSSCNPAQLLQPWM